MGIDGLLLILSCAKLTKTYKIQGVFMNLFSPFKKIYHINNFIKTYHTGLLRGSWTFFDNTLVYLFNKKPSRGPTFVGWNVTFDCNAKCSFCNTHELHEKIDRPITKEEALSVVRQLGEAGTWHLSLTGGETLMFKYLPEVIAEAKKYGMYVNVNTNGALLAKKAQRLVDSGLDSLIISLDSDEPKLHDTARVIPKLSDKIFKGIEAIKEAKKGGTKPEIVLRMVYSKQNYENIDRYIEKFQSIVDKISIQPIHDGIDVPKFKAVENLNLFNIKEVDIYQFIPKDRSKYRKVFTDLYKKHKWLDTKFTQEFETFIFDKNAYWDRYKCYAGYYYMVVDSALDTFPCTFFVDKFESLRDHKLMDVWQGEKIASWRKIVKNKENTCTCACGIAEVNVVLTNKLETISFHSPTRLEIEPQPVVIETKANKVKTEARVVKPRSKAKAEA